MTNIKPERLQKYLAHHGVASRRAVERMIEDGQIAINGNTAKLGATVTGTEKITIKGTPFTPSKSTDILLAFYKPRGVECTLSSTEGNRCLSDYDFGTERVYPVGRLDKDSEGLVLMTNNGTLAQELTHPSYEHEKEYVVSIQGSISDKQLERLSNGTIVVGDKPVNPAQVMRITDNTFSIILTEGRNRQIRKMVGAIGVTVSKLKRVRIGDYNLDNLQPGTWRKI